MENKTIKGRNELIPFTRRMPNLKEKQKIRDSKIAKRLVAAWDDRQDKDEVFNIWLKEHNQLSDPRYWEMLKTVWILCGSVILAPIFRNFMKSPRGYKSYFMTPEEKAYFDSLPDELTLYRAHNHADNGIAYTLSLSYAVTYQKMYNKALMETRQVKKSECFAYINRNAESEIIVL